MTVPKTNDRSRAAKPRPARPGGRSARVVRSVMQATLQAFVEQGYAGLSIEDVAARAGVNKTTVYRRWPTRAELVAAALFSLRDTDPPLPDTGCLRDDLLQLLVQRATLLKTPHRRAISQALLLSGTDPELSAVVERLRRERPLIPLGVLQRGIARGELPADTDLALVVDALLGPLHLRTYWRREAVSDAFLNALVGLVLRGAGGSHGADAP